MKKDGRNGILPERTRPFQNRNQQQCHDGRKFTHLPFPRIEADLCDKLLHSSSPKNDQTDGPLEFIQTIVDKVKEEFKESSKTKKEKHP